MELKGGVTGWIARDRVDGPAIDVTDPKAETVDKATIVTGTARLTLIRQVSCLVSFSVVTYPQLKF